MATPVLFIAGTGRSGSTVLANILGEVDGLFATGEVRYLWQRGLLEHRLCGCGLAVRDCPLWSDVLAQCDHGIAPTEMVAALRRTGRLRQVPLMAAARALPTLDPARRLASAALREGLGDLYARIAQVSDRQVVVDSSKLPAYANLLMQVPSIDLRVVHLVRDPRGAAHSWSSRKRLQDGAAQAEMERLGPEKSALLWDAWNLTAAALLDRGPGRYLRLRYEDLIAAPEASLRRVLALVGREHAALPLVGAGEARLGVNHSVAGNPDRLRSGVVRLRADERWLTEMSARDRTVVTALTAPLLLRYGYAVRPTLPAEPDETIFDRARADETRAARWRRRVRRHVRWGRTEGVGRLVEEDELNPLTRIRVATAKRRWRAAHAVPPGTAVPVYLVGLQRSGTNMLTRGLELAPEVEVHNENDAAAFDRFLLRSDDVVRGIVMRSRHRLVLFKPLSDSHRVDHLLDAIDTPSPGRAIWAYRDVDGRARSAVSKFGRNNLLVLRDIAAGRGDHLWQAQGLSAATLATLRAFDYDAMSAHTAAALFWWARNGLFFDLGLDSRHDVFLASYQEFLADPQAAMPSLCDFLGIAYRPELSAHIEARSGGGRRLDIDARVRELCDELQARLDGALRSQAREQVA